MAIEGPFQNQSNAITSFDFTDLITGVAYKTFFGLEVLKDTASADYILFPEVVASNSIVINAFTSSASFVKLIDLDFDITFNIPAILEGQAIIGFTHGIVSGTGGNVGQTYVVATLLKDGVQLDTGQSATLTGGATQADHTGLTGSGLGSGFGATTFGFFLGFFLGSGND